MLKRSLLSAGSLLIVSCVSVALLPPRMGTLWRVRASEQTPAQIAIDYPRRGSLFPPEITPPTFVWHDASTSSNRWRITVSFGDGSAPLQFDSRGEKPSVGAIDERCISSTNELPRLTSEQETAHTWSPSVEVWELIKKHSVVAPATVTITGLAQNDTRPLSSGSTVITTSKDPVRAPIFYRDVPLMPSETEKGIIKPLANEAVQLIQWRLKSIARADSRVVLTGMHTCANCHSFSLDGKIMGMDMDGPRNDKGLYAVAPIRPQMTIRNEDMVNWNPTGEGQFASNRVAFMSQVSPDGRYILSMVTRPDRPAENNYYVANFKDYRFLQVFYPTRGVLAWYDRATKQRHPLPGADDPGFVHTDGVWSPDGKYIVFARAEAREPYPQGGPIAARANDANELQIKYDLYRVPFNNGRGGKPEAIAGASSNGMSNSFPKVSPDGKWIVFVQAKNGQLMRPDSQLYIIPAAGGTARRLSANMAPMNSWHSWSPNSRWLVFSSKAAGPYTRMYLTHVDENGNDSPAIIIDNVAAANRAVNIPEFVNIPADGMVKIATPAVDMYKQFDHAVELGDKGEHEQAVVEWTALAAAHPDDARVQNNLALQLVQVGRPADAVAHFRKALQLNPQYYAVHGSLANALVKARQIGDALREYDAALQLYPGSPDLRSSYGSALARAGRLDEAILQLQKAIAINPALTEAHNNLGIAYAQQQRVSEAAQEFAKAVELNPRFAEAHNNLGIALLSDPAQAQPIRAEQEFREAIELNPKYAEAQVNLGVLYAQEGNHVDAERLLRSAIVNEPRSIKAYLMLGRSLAAQSRFSDAEAVLSQALMIAPDNRDAERLREDIRQSLGR